MVIVYDLISVNKFVILSKVFLIHILVPGTHLHPAFGIMEPAGVFLRPMVYQTDSMTMSMTVADCLLTAYTRRTLDYLSKNSKETQIKNHYVPSHNLGPRISPQKSGR